MNRTQIAMALVLREFGVNPTRLDNFRQKKNAIYLARAAGVAVSNHHFYWHYTGRIAAKEIGEDFDSIAIYMQAFDELKDFQLDEESRKSLAKLKPIVKNENLELLTSVHFLVAHSHKTNKLQRILKEYEQDYTKQQIQDAIAQLRSYELLKAG